MSAGFFMPDALEDLPDKCYRRKTVEYGNFFAFARSGFAVKTQKPRKTARLFSLCGSLRDSKQTFTPIETKAS